MAAPAETEKRYQLTPAQLIAKGFSHEVNEWLYTHNWYISAAQTGNGGGEDEELFLAAPQNPGRFTCEIRLGIPAAGRPISCGVFLQRYAGGEQEPLVAPTPYKYPECELSVSPLILTSRGNERWLQISKPEEEVLGSSKRETIQISPYGIEFQQTIRFDTPFLTAVGN